MHRFHLFYLTRLFHFFNIILTLIIIDFYRSIIECSFIFYFLFNVYLYWNWKEIVKQL